jgi:serine/threonine protein kinase
MTPERWEKIKGLLGTVLEVTPEKRTSYLDQSCANDEPLRRDVEVFLQREREAGSRFLSPEGLEQAATTLFSNEPSPWIGRRVGAYQIVEQIGAGGMGEVYRAFRADDQYRQEVALKVIRSGQDSGSVISRFKNERQILASLDHPNIARLLDGGTISEGLPYLVMELIQGQPIVEYCDARGLSVSERLELFLQVCSAVQYAHQHLIIHRDIKPGNILVPGDGSPKLLDFGIAKIVDAQNEVDGFQSTLTMFRVLTPQYASPEQIKGEPITTASDVYSLGVVLYELLTGRSPNGESKGTSQDAIRALCESEAVRPSLAVRAVKSVRSSTGATTASEYRAQAVSTEKLAKQLRGDLDNIILMALRKEPQRRYASVEQFAADIRRNLANLPVVARKDTARYRASKFFVRHKAGVAAATVVVFVLVAGIVVTMREARVAQRRFDDVRALANSLIFDVHDSIKDLPGSTPARKIIVDRALQYLNVLAHESAGDRGLQRELASAYERVGSVQGDYLENNLGDAEGTLASYRKALALRQQIALASKDLQDRIALAQGYRLVAHQLWANGDPRAAREPIAKAIAISEALNTEKAQELKILYELAFDYEVSGRIGYPDDPSTTQKIVQDFRRALAVDETVVKLQPNDIYWLHGYSTDLGSVGNMLEASDPAEALKTYQKELEIDRRLTQLSSDVRFRRSVAIEYGEIASVYDDIGDYQHAVKNNGKDLAIYQELVRTDPKNALLRQGLAITYMNTGASCARAGQMAQALQYSKAGLDIMQSLVASAPPNGFQRGIFAAMLIIRGTILTKVGKPDEAIAQIDQGRTIYETLSKTGAKNVSNMAQADVKLGEAALKAGHDQKASDYFRRALTIAAQSIASDPPDLDALYAAADAHSGLGDLSLKKAGHAGLIAERRKSYLSEARSNYQNSLETWHRIPHPNHTSPSSFQAGDPILVAKQLKQTEAALANLH